MNGKRKRNEYDDFDWREYLTTLHPDIGGFSLWENKMTESKEIDLDIPKFRSTLVKHFYKFLSNKKLLRILPCQDFHLS